MAKQKLGKTIKESVVNRLKKEISGASSLFILEYLGLSSVQMTLLRNSLRGPQSQVLVTKNSLIRKALKESKIEGLDNAIEGPLAIVFSSDDICATSKILVKFAKENEKLILKRAYYQERVFSGKEIEAISNLPTRKVLLAQAVGSMKAPLSGLVFCLSGILNKFVLVLNQIKEIRRF